MKYYLTVFALLIAVAGISQISFNNPDVGGVVSFRTTAIKADTPKTEGSPYFEEEFKFGQVLSYDKVQMSGKLRYNAYTSELELQKNKWEYSSILKRRYISAVIGDTKYKVLAYKDDVLGNVKTGYFNPLNDGEIQLLFKPEIKIKRGRSAATSYDRTVAPRFIDVSAYYIKKAETPAEKIYLRKKYVLEALDNDAEIKKFVKANKLNLRKVDDIIKVVDFYNQKFTEKTK